MKCSVVESLYYIKTDSYIRFNFFEFREYYVKLNGFGIMYEIKQII